MNEKNNISFYSNTKLVFKITNDGSMYRIKDGELKLMDTDKEIGIEMSKFIKSLKNN